MSAIISIYGCCPAARIAKGFVVCWDGSSMGCWPEGPILCTDGTANAVGDGWWFREEPSIYLAATNGNYGKVGSGSKLSFGATIRRSGK